MRTLREQKTCLMHVYPVRPMARSPLERVLNATNGLAVFPEKNHQPISNFLHLLSLPLCSLKFASFDFNWRTGYIGNFRRLFSRESRSIVIVTGQTFSNERGNGGRSNNTRRDLLTLYYRSESADHRGGNRNR